jgi:hypothetical protein
LNNPEWALVFVGILTLIFLGWQAVETARAAKATTLAAEATQASAKATEVAAIAAQRNSEVLINSERAWILAELGWYKGDRLHVAEHTSLVAGRPATCTEARVLLTFRNEGKSPAWVQEIYAHLSIAARSTVETIPKREDMTSFKTVDVVVGAGKEKFRALQLQCTGHRTKDEFLRVYVIVEYKDIFESKRETMVGYGIQSNGEFYCEETFPDRNRNT